MKTSDVATLERTSDDAGHDVMLTVAEASRLYDVTRSTLTRWIHEGKLPAIKTLGGKCSPFRLRRADVERVSATIQRGKATNVRSISGDKDDDDLLSSRPRGDDVDWTRALCTEYDPSWWEIGTGSVGNAKAKTICASLCPIRDECLQYGMDIDGIGFIWGGQAIHATRFGTKTCEECGSTFPLRITIQRFCRPACAAANSSRKRPSRDERAQAREEDETR